MLNFKRQYPENKLNQSLNEDSVTRRKETVNDSYITLDEDFIKEVVGPSSKQDS